MGKPTVQPTGVKRVEEQNDDEEDAEREREVESMVREEGERLVGTTESLKSSGGEGERATERR